MIKKTYILSIIFLFLFIAVMILTKIDFLRKESNSLSKFDPSNAIPQRMKQITIRGNRKYILQPPINYDRTIKYPLVIGLHGWTKSKDAYFTPIMINNIEQMAKYPCFYLTPNNQGRGWGDKAEWVRVLIKKLMEDYPIDESRIYIIGFSMGGSGSYLFADALYKEQQIVTSAIVRIAGKSQTRLSSTLQDKTAVWYHVGAEDSKEILNIAYDAYNLRSSNSQIQNKYEEKGITIYSVTDKDPQFLLSVYKGMGHNYRYIFTDDKVIKWLFERVQ